MKPWPVFRERENITGKQLLCCGLIWMALVGLACQKPTPRNTELQVGGKTYVVAGLQGAGFTKQHRSPVYTLVVMSKEDSKKWVKK